MAWFKKSEPTPADLWQRVPPESEYEQVAGLEVQRESTLAYTIGALPPDGWYSLDARPLRVAGHMQGKTTLTLVAGEYAVAQLTPYWLKRLRTHLPCRMVTQVVGSDLRVYIPREWL